MAGRVRRLGGMAGAVVAAMIFIPAAALFCFPVWTNYSPVVGSDQYFHRYWAETWIYGSELWEVLHSQELVAGRKLLSGPAAQDARRPTLDEGWNFPGFTVALAVLIAGVAWLRGSEFSKKLDPFVGVSLGLMAFWMILSLAGDHPPWFFTSSPASAAMAVQACLSSRWARWWRLSCSASWSNAVAAGSYGPL